ncbi:hypothetical protein SAMN04515647_2233 [Cohaesibacter sp. ES.047]|nr:hypothetical protein SAMN04515647_2233 [Cohaesibacter sp. ES.047]
MLQDKSTGVGHRGDPPCKLFGRYKRFKFPCPVHSRLFLQGVLGFSPVMMRLPTNVAPAG